MKSVFTLMICALYSVLSFAQDVVVGLNTATTARWEVVSYGNDPLKVRQYTFANGLTLITSNQTKSPRVYTMVAVRTGSKNDPAEHTGLAHYLEHMLFKGTDRYGSLDWAKEAPLLKQIDQLYERYNHSTDAAERKSIYRAIDSVSQLAAKFSIANEYDKMCQALGAQGTNAFTSNDETVYINDIPSNMVNKWIALEAERFRNPILRLFHTELEAVYEEKNISMDRVGDKVYEVLGTKEGLDRAFAKLDTIKDQVIWWEAGAQPPQLLADGEVVMTTAYNGRIFDAAVMESKPVEIIWDGQLLELDVLGIVKGTKRLEQAMQFVAFATDTQRLADQARWIAYGPARKSSLPLVGTHADKGIDMKPHMPNAPENAKNAIQIDFLWWADRQEELNQRWAAWLAK